MTAHPRAWLCRRRRSDASATRSPPSTRSRCSAACSGSTCSPAATRSRRCGRCAAAAPTRWGRSWGSCRSRSTTSPPSTRSRTSPTPTCPNNTRASSGSPPPRLRVAATLLVDSRGLLTLAPVLVMGALGTVALYRRGRRAEALVIGGVCLCYLTYNSGYYLPFGGGSLGPRFLATTLPFLALPLAIAFKRWPGPTIALAAASVTCALLAAITHPLIGYETETGHLDAPPAQGLLPAHDRHRLRPRARLGGDLGLPAPGRRRDRARRGRHPPHAPDSPLAARRGARARPRGRCTRRSPPRCSASTTRACSTSYHSGDPRALTKGAYFGPYPLRALVPLACGFALLALAAARVLRGDADAPPEHWRRIIHQARRAAPCRCESLPGRGSRARDRDEVDQFLTVFMLQCAACSWRQTTT